MREKFPKLGLSIFIINFCFLSANHVSKLVLHSHGPLSILMIVPLCFVTVNHLDYLGVQVAWVTGPWFLTIFMNMLPWESGQVLCFFFFFF